MKTLEDVVAQNRISLGTAKEYEDLCSSVRDWLKKSLVANGVSQVLLEEIFVRSPKKIFLNREIGGRTKRIMKRVAAQEEEAARIIEGKMQPFSGRLSLKAAKADARSNDYLVEAKQTEFKSLGVKVEWIEKLCNEAVGLGLEPMFHFRFDAIGNQFPKDWVMVSSREYERLKDAAKSGCKPEDL